MFASRTPSCRRAHERWRTVASGLTTATAVAVALTLVGACQANPEPAPFAGPESTGPAPTAATPPSASPTPTPPELPPAATGTGRAAAKAFVRHYIDLVNHAMATGDVDGLAGIAASSCATCDAIRRRIVEIYDQGHAEGDGWRIKALTYVPTGSSRTALVAAAIEIAPQTVFSPGAAPSHSAASRGNLDFRLRASSDGWTIARLEATQ
jgi:hypothetical protein